MPVSLFKLKVQVGGLPHLLTTAYVYRAFAFNLDYSCSVKNTELWKIQWFIGKIQKMQKQQKVFFKKMYS